LDPSLYSSTSTIWHCRTEQAIPTCPRPVMSQPITSTLPFRSLSLFPPLFTHNPSTPSCPLTLTITKAQNPKHAPVPTSPDPTRHIISRNYTDPPIRTPSRRAWCEARHSEGFVNFDDFVGGLRREGSPEGFSGCCGRGVGGISGMICG